MKSIQITKTFTNRDELTNIFFNQINKYSILTPAEELALVKKLGVKGKEGEKAREKLIVSNIRFVVSVANHYADLGLSLNDLINEGCVGLCRACDAFDPSRNCRFLSYAVEHIRAQIIDALEKNGHVVATTHEICNLSNKYRHYSEKAFNEDGRTLSAEEFAEMMNISVKKAQQVVRSIEDAVSLDTPLGSDDDEPLTLGNILVGDCVNESQFDNEGRRLAIIDSLRSVLNERDTKAVLAYFGISKQSLNEVALEYGCTYESLLKAIGRGIERVRRNASIMARLNDYRHAA